MPCNGSMTSRRWRSRNSARLVEDEQHRVEVADLYALDWHGSEHAAVASPVVDSETGEDEPVDLLRMPPLPVPDRSLTRTRQPAPLDSR